MAIKSVSVSVMTTNPDPATGPRPSRRLIGHLLAAWTWRMAWRDTRTSRRKLALYGCSIVLGIAALAAGGSLGTNLERAIEEQTKSLRGADLVIQSQAPFTPEAEQLFQPLGGEQSREVSLTTMAYFPRTEDTRLVQVHALSGGFPFYGNLETEPASATEQLRQPGGGWWFSRGRHRWYGRLSRRRCARQARPPAPRPARALPATIRL